MPEFRLRIKDPADERAIAERLQAEFPEATIHKSKDRRTYWSVAMRRIERAEPIELLDILRYDRAVVERIEGEYVVFSTDAGGINRPNLDRLASFNVIVLASADTEAQCMERTRHELLVRAHTRALRHSQEAAYEEQRAAEV